MGLKNDLGNWYNLLQQEFSKEYMKLLSAKLRIARMKRVICPDKESVFRAYNLTQPEDVKVVIIGQD